MNNRKIIKIFAILLLVIIVFCFISIAETTYKRDAVIVQVSDTITIAEDLNGNNWAFYDKGYYVGQEVTLIMNTNNTNSNIFDDLVENVLTKE